MPKQNSAKQHSQNPFTKMEEEVLNFWEKGKIFEKSMDKPGGKSSDSQDYVFFDGPPFATGEPHYGHIVASIMKDAIPRYWTMRGYRVERRWGWDCHGLPVENLAEKELGFKSKQDIETMGVAKFNDYCKSIVLRYAEEWKKTIRRIGRWVDMENDYKTMDPDFMETIWWVFKSLWDKGLVYKGYKAMHICPRCGTTLSNFEVTQNYKDIKDLSAIVKFELEDEPGTYVLAWTTTPWTLIGNVALAVGEDIKYLKVSSKKPAVKSAIYIVAEDRAKEIFKDFGYEIVEKVKGKDLIGKKYEPIFDYYSQDEKLENRANGWRIYDGDFVTTEDGTGVVHIAPAFGEDDMKLGRENNLPFIQHVALDGTIKLEAHDFAGMNVKPSGDTQKTDVEIIKYLAHNGLLFDKEKYEHSYPHCWRCETPLLNYATDSWFVKVTDIKDGLIKNNQKIRWVPEHIKDGRFGKWLEQARDWAISRNRYWGATLPVWVCDKCDGSADAKNQKLKVKSGCGNIKVLGSIKELEELSGQKIEDLHKHVVDKITFKCDKCDGTMKRIPEVFDCWFESGSMPYAQEHYPFVGKKYKNDSPVPADFIAEGIDQTRGWFYTMTVLSAALFGCEPSKNIIANGIVLAEDGQKMSKRLKNYPDPSYLFEQYGVDAMRYYLFASPVMVAENLNFSEDGVKESLRKIVMILWNVYKFYEMYEEEVKNEKSEVGSEGRTQDCQNVLDKWILAKLNILIKDVSEGMDNYNLPRAARPIDEFINDLSTWYLRRSRERFKSDDAKDKQAALNTTKYVLIELAKAMSPFTPFIAERLWQKTTGFDFKDENKSVHLEKWPEYNESLKNENLKIVEEMEQVRKIVELGLSKRDEVGIKVRQALNKFSIFNFQFSIKQEYINLIKEEINVKEVVINKGEGEIKVELDTIITDDLKLEGLKREIVRLANNLRKHAGLTIQDKIILLWQSDSEMVKNVFSQMKDELKKDTLSEKIIESEDGEEVKVNGVKIKLGIKKI